MEPVVTEIASVVKIAPVKHLDETGFVTRTAERSVTDLLSILPVLNITKFLRIIEKLD
jgi:hypothetical protein